MYSIFGKISNCKSIFLLDILTESLCSDGLSNGFSLISCKFTFGLNQSYSKTVTIRTIYKFKILFEDTHYFQRINSENTM